MLERASEKAGQAVILYYPGPELEMWALGVTLYTLVFGESPFFDVEETISGHLQPPYFTSPGLMKVFLWLLHPDPKSRATLKDLERDRWTNQEVDISQYSFESVLGIYIPIHT
jgi:serine/threonine protein kinase